jgi:hypothetical protein
VRVVRKSPLGQKSGDSGIATCSSSTTYSDGSQVWNVGNDSASQKMSQW